MNYYEHHIGDYDQATAHHFSIGQPVATGAATIPARRRTPDPITGGMRGTSMTKDEYRKLLLHPNWQKKRLEILNRDRFECRECGDDESTLHVHHQFYKTDANPWDYPDDSLLTLCESCHEFEHESAKRIARDLLISLRSAGLNLGDVEYITHGIGLIASENRPQVLRAVETVIAMCGFRGMPPDDFVAFSLSLDKPVSFDPSFD